MGSAGDELENLLDEQAAYRAVAPEYEDGALPFPGEAAELSEALDAFRPTGSVLELACGAAIWTNQLLRHATDITGWTGLRRCSPSPRRG
jgi:demethylmenaquinone methyltransferase/2-methoxy-6-polyprenyl-1,4-benzoquinol methylase